MDPQDKARDGADQTGSAGATTGKGSSGSPIFPTLDELRDLPQRLLPEETVLHLKNAGREALLALYSLWRSIDAARLGKETKVRKHIDVE